MESNRFAGNQNIKSRNGACQVWILGWAVRGEAFGEEANHFQMNRVYSQCRRECAIFSVCKWANVSISEVFTKTPRWIYNLTNVLQIEIRFRHFINQWAHVLCVKAHVETLKLEGGLAKKKLCPQRVEHHFLADIYHIHVSSFLTIFINSEICGMKPETWLVRHAT